MGDGKLLTWPWMEILQPWKRCNKRKGVWQCGKRLPQGRTLRMQHHPCREYHPHHRQGEQDEWLGLRQRRREYCPSKPQRHSRGGSLHPGMQEHQLGLRDDSGPLMPSPIPVKNSRREDNLGHPRRYVHAS